jgi:hypothetical protein
VDPVNNSALPTDKQMNVVCIFGAKLNCMEQSRRETDSRLASQETPCLLWSSKDHTHTPFSHSSPPMFVLRLG